MIPEPALDAPDEEWSVWADAAQQIGDPRGELLALGHADSYVHAHADALLGGSLARHLRKGDIRITRWRRCYVDEIELRIEHVDDGPPLVKNVFTAPSAQHMRSLVVAGVPSRLDTDDLRVVDLAWTIEWLGRRDLVALPPQLRALSLVDDRARSVDHLMSRDWQPDPNRVSFGPLVGLYTDLAHLEELALVVADPAQVQFGRIRLPDLTSFTLHGLRWSPGLGEFLASAQWPKLRSLDLRLVDRFIDNEPDDAHAYAPIWSVERPLGGFAGNMLETDWRGELEPLLDALQRLPIERLALRAFEDADTIIPVLLEHLPPTLVELDLTDAALRPHHLELLAQLPVRVIGRATHAAKYRYIITYE